MESLIMTIFSLLIIGSFILGMAVERFMAKNTRREDGFYIIDDRNPDKMTVTVDLHKEHDDISKQKFIMLRVLEKK